MIAAENNLTFSNPAARITRVLLLLLPAAVILLAGCQSPHAAVGVTSPPPPRFGSAPIAAYDDYALVLNRRLEGSHLETVAQVLLH